MIKILIVEDSPSVCKILTRVLESDPELMVVGAARTGEEGVRLALKLKPDIITMDIMMPDMDGVEATKQIMAYQPTPVLVLTASREKKADAVFQAISYGALDVVEKVAFEQGEVCQDTRAMLIAKIKLLSRIKVIKHPLAKLKGKPPVSMPPAMPPDAGFKRIVAIAASTGGPQALLSILSRIPKNCPLAVLIVQHIARGFIESLVDWLANSCSVEVKLAQNNEKIRPAAVYLAPTDAQMKVKEEGLIQLSYELPEGHFKPSANILFNSIARVYKDKAIGVILTGMGKDGVSGIKALKEAGGMTIAQNKETSVVFGMPKEAIDIGAIDRVLPVGKIADEIINSL